LKQTDFLEKLSETHEASSDAVEVEPEPEPVTELKSAGTPESVAHFI